MSMNVSDFVWHRLQEWGLKRVYGYPGDGVGGLDVALEKAKDKLQYVQVRHEEMAAFMASAHAKFTGEVGLCYATSGPGAIHLLNGLYDAKMDHVPVVAIVGQQARICARRALSAGSRSAIPVQGCGGGFRGDGQRAQPGPPPDRPGRAHRQRPSEPSPASSSPTICRSWPTRIRRWSMAPPIPASAMPARRNCRTTDLLRQAADVLNAGKKVAILVGAGALGATDEVIAVAERLQAGVAKALLGKAALPDDLPWVTGSLGLLGTKPSWDLMKGCDTFLMIGSAFPYSEFLPKPGDARGVQIDIDGTMAQPALPDGGQHGRRQRRHPARVAAAAGAEAGRSAGARRSRPASPPGGRRSKSARWSRPIRSIRSACSGSCRSGCRRTAS